MTGSFFETITNAAPIGQAVPGPVPVAPMQGIPFAGTNNTMLAQTYQPAPQTQLPAPATGVPVQSFDPASLAAPNTQQVTQANVPQAQPVDPFANLWNTTDKSGNTITEPVLSTGINFNIDPATMQQAAEQINFAKDVSPDLLATIVGGGEQALPALQKVLNDVGRQGFLINSQATVSLVEAAVKQANNNVQSIVQKELRLAGLNNVQKQHQALSNPAFSPIVQQVAKQMQLQYPNASQDELAAMLPRYFEHFAQSMGFVKAPEQPQSRGPAATDWASYLFANN
jgi:hypothetical protein